MNNETENKENMSEQKVKKTTKKKVVAKKETKTPTEIGVQQFESLEGKFLLVKVGNDARPATDDDIEQIEGKLTGLLEENNVNCLAFVTHHAVEIEIIEKLK